MECTTTAAAGASARELMRRSGGAAGESEAQKLAKQLIRTSERWRPMYQSVNFVGNHSNSHAPVRDRATDDRMAKAAPCQSRSHRPRWPVAPDSPSTAAGSTFRGNTGWSSGIRAAGPTGADSRCTPARRLVRVIGPFISPRCRRHLRRPLVGRRARPRRDGPRLCPRRRPHRRVRATRDADHRRPGERYVLAAGHGSAAIAGVSDQPVDDGLLSRPPVPAVAKRKGG